LGEVHAFITLVIDTYQRGQAGFIKTLPADTITDTVATLTTLCQDIESQAAQAGQDHITLTKSAKTLAKISRARDDYIAERWDDTVELYEWFSFNAGAGAAHAHEVAGAAHALKDEELAQITAQAEAYFDNLLLQTKDYLYQEAVSRAA
jgi:hypothetical protein